ncbi:MAG: ABC transporter permease [Nitriliruptoraceae bacterium]
MPETTTDPDLVREPSSDEDRSALAQLVRDPGRVWGYVGVPLVVAVSWIAAYRWVSALELDSIEQRWLNAERVTRAIVEHLQLSLAATVLVIVIAVPLGIVLTRPFAKPLTPVFIGIANVGQAIPSVGLLFFLALPFALGIGERTATVGVVAYCLLPVLRNTMVGIQQVDRALIEAGRGMGLTRGAVLARIELPLAVPVILAGIRTALILTVGTMALATFINAGGLGDLINGGIVNNRTPILLTGAVLTAGLALLIDWVAGIAEEVLRPRGL